MLCRGEISCHPWHILHCIAVDRDHPCCIGRSPPPGIDDPAVHPCTGKIGEVVDKTELGGIQDMGPSPGIVMDGEDPSGSVLDAVDHRSKLRRPFPMVPSLSYKVKQGIGGDHRGDIPLDKDAHL